MEAAPADSSNEYISGNKFGQQNFSWASVNFHFKSCRNEQKLNSIYFLISTNSILMLLDQQLAAPDWALKFDLILILITRKCSRCMGHTQNLRVLVFWRKRLGQRTWDASQVVCVLCTVTAMPFDWRRDAAAGCPLAVACFMLLGVCLISWSMLGSSNCLWMPLSIAHDPLSLTLARSCSLCMDFSADTVFRLSFYVSFFVCVLCCCY